LSDVTGDNEELADRYDRISNAQFILGRHLIEKMGVNEGDAVLDVGCGTGRLALSVSETVGPTGKVIGLDPSPYRIEVANRKLVDRPRPNLQFMVGMAEDLGRFPEAMFDCVYYSSVFHWIGEKEKALSEAYRVLEPGGCIGMTMPSPGSMSVLREAIVEVALRPPYARHVNRRTIGRSRVDLAGLEALLVQAGFGDPMVEVRERRKFHRSARDLIEFYDASSFGNFLWFMHEDLRESLKEEIIRELEKRRTADGIEMVSRPIIATARKPA